MIYNNIQYFNIEKFPLSGCVKDFYGWFDYWFVDWTQTYIPIKVKLQDGNHFGWICLSVSRATGALTIHDYALSKVAEKAINAGQK